GLVRALITTGRALVERDSESGYQDARAMRAEAAERFAKGFASLGEVVMQARFAKNAEELGDALVCRPEELAELRRMPATLLDLQRGGLSGSSIDWLEKEMTSAQAEELARFVRETPADIAARDEALGRRVATPVVKARLAAALGITLREGYH